MTLDILAFGAHPDDVELGCGGTLIAHIATGKTAGIVDLTRGELGTRGTVEDRYNEATESARLLGIKVRENLGMEDGHFEINTENKLKVVEMLRKYRPALVLCNAVSDRHPDHGKGGQLVVESCFLSGLPKVKTVHEGMAQAPWRPKIVLHYIQDYFLRPDIVIDITHHFEAKMDAIKAFKTQFYSPDSKEPETPISTPHFMDFLEGRARDAGRYIGVPFGEGFNTTRPVGIADLTTLF